MPPVVRSSTFAAIGDGLNLIGSGFTSVFAGVWKVIAAFPRLWQRVAGYIALIALALVAVVLVVDRFGKHLIFAVANAGVNFFQSLAGSSVQEI